MSRRRRPRWFRLLAKHRQRVVEELVDVASPHPMKADRGALIDHYIATASFVATARGVSISKEAVRQIVFRAARIALRIEGRSPTVFR